MKWKFKPNFVANRTLDTARKIFFSNFILFPFQVILIFLHRSASSLAKAIISAKRNKPQIMQLLIGVD